MAQKIMRTNKIKTAKATIIFNILAYTAIGLVTLFCLLPFIMLISSSFTSEQAIAQYGFGVWPKEFSIDAYEMIFKNLDELLRAFGVTIFITGVGTVVGMLLTSMTAYVLSRQDFKYRNGFSFYFYFTTLLNGGVMTTYIFFVRYLKLRDNYMALILPLLVNVFYLLIMRSFMSAIPTEIIESAKMDGAGDFMIYVKFALPLSKAGLATIGLFIMLNYWNDWYNAMLFISDYKKYPLQYLLYNMLAASDAISRLAVSSGISVVDMPTQSLKMAMAVISMLPVLICYPFVQKYFTKGITVGSVKG